LVTFMAHRNAGRNYMNQISREFGLKLHERKDLQKVFRDEKCRAHFTAIGAGAQNDPFDQISKSFGPIFRPVQRFCQSRDLLGVIRGARQDIRRI